MLLVIMKEKDFGKSEEDLLGKDLVASISESDKEHTGSLSLKSYCEESFANSLGFMNYRQAFRSKTAKNEVLDLNRRISTESSFRRQICSPFNGERKQLFSSTTKEYPGHVIGHTQYFDVDDYGEGEELIIDDISERDRLPNITLEPKRLTTREYCRKQQELLNELNPSDLIALFEVVEPCLNSLMTDKFANYYISKLYSKLNELTKTLFLSSLELHLVEVADNKAGTFCLQAVVESTQTSQLQQLLAQMVNKQLQQLMYGDYSVHVVAKLISAFPPDETIKIRNTLLTNIFKLSKHYNGYRLIVETIKIAEEGQREQIKTYFINKFDALVNNEFGNQPIQAAIRSWQLCELSEVIKKFVGRFVEFSFLKYSSNLIESIIELEEDYLLGKMVEEIKQKKAILQMVTHAFGNYVVQKFLKVKAKKHVKTLAVMIEDVIKMIQEVKLRRKWVEILKSHTSIICDEEAYYSDHEVVYRPTKMITKSKFK